MWERRTQNALIRHCINEHKGCQTHDTDADVEPFLPSRLIDVRSRSNIHLVPKDEIQSGSDRDRRYIALSYCWGPKMPESGKALSSTVDALRQKIDPSALPATPRDAIELTKALGIPFLWIDALCIVQDDKADWAREAATMCSVYSQAFLTIAAGASNHCDGGFLKTSYAKKDLPVPLTGFGLNLDFTPAKQPNVWVTPFLQNPLFARGWVLQERELSPRILHYTRTHVVWECREEVCAYIRPRGLLSSPKVTYIDLDHWSSYWPYRCFDVPSDRKGGIVARSGRAWPGQPRALRFETWQRVVESFSRRRLTYASDKLPAIAGLADEVRRFVDSEYLAGLWRDNLLRDLLWKRTAPHTMHAAHDSSAYYAPSWSWAWTNFPISFRNDAETDEAEVIEAGVKKGSDGDEKLEAGFVRLRVRVLEIQGSAGAFTNDDSVHVPSDDKFTVCILRSARTIPAEWGGREGQQLVQEFRAGGGIGLVLRRAEGAALEFRRIGMVEQVSMEALEDVEFQEITIV